MGDAVVIGEVIRAHGIRGEVRARATGPTLGALAVGDDVDVTDRDGRRRQMRIASRTDAGDTLLLGFSGLTTRDAAEALRGAVISVDARRLRPPAGPDEFYVRELIGCTVRVGDAVLGTVAEVITRPANDVLEVATRQGPRVLLPFTRDAVLAIDLPGRTIRLRAGLLEPGDVAELEGQDAG